jgi:hypothetical protein
VSEYGVDGLGQDRDGQAVEALRAYLALGRYNKSAREVARPGKKLPDIATCFFLFTKP